MLVTQHKKPKPYNVGYVPSSDTPDDDTLMSKEEFFAKLDRSLEEIRQGKGTRIRSKEELRDYFA
ncbi:MAG: hypothetical protein LBT94_08965, partial [Prevotellaceae bacterium]|nr:hypothetical protein [Prevotellaceae bacterium]